MKRMTLLIAVMLMLSVSAFAQITAVPPLMHFQGRLAKPDGTSVANGNYNLLLSLYSAPTGGTVRWQCSLVNVPVKNGTFAARLDFSGGYQNGATQASLFGASAAYLEITINGGAPLAPRQPLVTVAYAMKADSVKDGSITSNSILNGTITGADIANGTITADKFATGIFNPVAWLLRGNSGTNPATQFLGTTDNQPLEFRVNNRRVMRFSSENIRNDRIVSVLGGSEVNEIEAGVVGATIAGGGYDSGAERDYPNRVLGDFGAIGGGYGNIAGAPIPTLMGEGNAVSGTQASTVGGGFSNTVRGSFSTIGGGAINEVSGDYSTIAGGENNRAFDFASTVGGGVSNTANGNSSTIAGGNTNNASGHYSAVPGGFGNTAQGHYSFAAGYRAKANHMGAFVWGDRTEADVASTADNQFLIRARGGVKLTSGTSLELGVGFSGKEVNAGKIGYALFAPNVLDIVGAGTTHLNRKVRIWAEGGTTFAGDIIGEGYASIVTDAFVGRDLYVGSNAAVTGALSCNTLYVSGLPFGDRRNVQWDDVTKEFFYDSSSRRYKENIAPLKDDFLNLLSAQPKTYTRPGAPGRWEIGYIAEEFDAIGLKRLVDYEPDGVTPAGINYEKICLYLTEVVKRQQKQIESVEKKSGEVDALKHENVELKSVLADILTRLEKVEAHSRR
jgi:hypothetical protein